MKKTIAVLAAVSMAMSLAASGSRFERSGCGAQQFCCRQRSRGRSSGRR